MKFPKITSVIDWILSHPVLTVICSILLYILVSAAFNMPSQEEISETESRSDAYWCAREEVTSLLKSPSTAEFPNELYKNVTQKAGDNHYVVSSYVDAQNEFGAVLRSQYSCDVHLLQGGGCRTECSIQ